MCDNLQFTVGSKPTPDGVAGYDVNRGCKPSYSGDEVTAQNFLAVLKGDNKTTGMSAATCRCETGHTLLAMLPPLYNSDLHWGMLNSVRRRGTCCKTRLSFCVILLYSVLATRVSGISKRQVGRRSWLMKRSLPGKKQVGHTK